MAHSAGRWLVFGAVVGAWFPAVASGNAIAAFDPAGEFFDGDGSDERWAVPLAVERESLVLDLRPLEDEAPARVTAEYRLRNDRRDGPSFGDMRGPATTRTWVLFVAPGMVDAEAQLDERELFVAPTALCGLRPEWRPPAEVPAPDGGVLPLRAAVTPRARWCGAGRRAVEAFRFHLAVPPGEHVLRVTYHLEPGRAGAAQRTLAYVFGHSDRWAGFGPVEVEVRLPPFWRAAASFPLRRDGDRLTSSFETLPATSLELSLRPPPERWNPWERRLPWIVAAAGLVLLLGLLGTAVFRELGRERPGRR